MNKTDGSDLASQIKSIQDELVGLTDTIRSFASERVAAGAHAVRGAADVASDTLRYSGDEARRRGQRIADDLETQITGNPLPAVLVAAGIGLVIGAVLSRR
jgi:ElaB/YqjD/DUF883 family membrane-anchored ribosome-binding protein